MQTIQTEPMDVLIVDDDSFILRTLSDILRIRGYTPVTAASGTEGMRLAHERAQRPMIALVDLKLPDMDGIDLVRSLHSISAGTEVVILTGNASVDSAVRALREQSFDYLIKPVHPEALFTTIEKAEERRYRKQAERDRRRSDEQLLHVFDAVVDGLLITDERNIIVRANSTARALLASGGADLIGRSLADILCGTDRLARAASPPTSGLAGEHVIRGPDEKERLLEVREAPLTEGQRVHVVRDLTQQRRIEEHLRHSQKIEATGRLAGGVAHDFNNILTAIEGYADLLLMDLPEQEEEPRESALEIKHAAHRAGMLTRQLLAFSRRQVSQPRLIELQASISGMEGMLRRLIPEHIELVTDYRAPGGAVCADPGQIEQVALNLVVNARDAMPKGGAVKIAVSVLDLDEEAAATVDPGLRAGEYLVLAVGDTGIGMDEETRARIFEPFFTTKEVGKGTGLGLATVFGTVEALGGHIAVESAPGVGSTFRIYIPAVRGEVEGHPVDDLPIPEGTESGRTILVVEDDEMVRGLVRKVLGQHGYQVLEAANGADAMRMLADRSVDLVITDVVMPGMTGKDLGARIAERTPGIRILYTSGYPEDIIARHGVLDPGVEYLAKPFSPRELFQAVERVLNAPAPGAD